MFLHCDAFVFFQFGRQHRRVLHARNRDNAGGVIALAARGWGKTAVSLHLAAQAALSRAARDTCLWLTPVVDQFRAAWRGIKQAYHRHIGRAAQFDGRLEFRGAGALEFRSAFEPDHLRGKTYRAAIVDEAALISAEGWHSCIRPTQRRADDWYVLLTTPRGGDWVGHLRSIVNQRALAEWRERSIQSQSQPAGAEAGSDRRLEACATTRNCATTSQDARSAARASPPAALRMLRFPAQWSASSAPSAAGESAAAPRLRFADNLDPARIAAAQAELPAAVFDREYLCRFGAASQAAFHDIDRHVDPTLTPLTAEAQAELQRRVDVGGAQHRYVLGVDWGFARDYTVACVMDFDRGAVVEVYRQRRVSSAAMAETVADLARRYGDAFCLCDVTGLQDQALGLLHERKIWALGFIFSAASKTSLIEHLLVGWERGAVAIPPFTPLIEELQQFESSYLPATRQRSYGPPAGSHSHDDCVIALALAWWAKTNYPADLRAPPPPPELPPVNWDRYFL